MGKYFHNVNEGLSPHDPEYDDSFDLDEEYERYLLEMELKEEQERVN